MKPVFFLESLDDKESNDLLCLISDSLSNEAFLSEVIIEFLLAFGKKD